MKALAVLSILYSSMNHDIIMHEALSDRLTLINPCAAQFGLSDLPVCLDLEEGNLGTSVPLCL